MFVTFAVLKLLKSSSENASQQLNIAAIFSTFDVSKFSPNVIDSNAQQPLNIYSMAVTFAVLNILKSNSVNVSQ